MSLSSITEKVCPQPLRPLLDRVKGSPLARRITAGAFWVMFGSVFAKGFGFLATILTARILEVKTFGEFELIRSTANMFLVFMAYGAGTTATKYISEYLATDKERTERIISLNYLFTIIAGGLVTLTFYLLSPFLCKYIVNAPHLVREMQFGAVLLILVTFINMQSGILAGFQDFRGLAWTETITGFFKVPLYVGGAYFWGLHGVLVTFGISLILTVLLNTRVIYSNTRKHNIRNSFRGAYLELPVLWKFSLPSTLAGIIALPTIWVCGALLVRHNGLAEFGVYNAALQIQVLLMYFPTLLLKVMLPLMSEVHGLKNRSRFKKLVVANVAINTGVTGLVALPLCLFSTQIMGLYGSGFAAGGNIVIVFCLVAIAAGPDWVLSQVLTSQGRMWSVFGLNVVWMVALITTTILFLSLHYGGVSIALGLLAANLARMTVAAAFMALRHCTHRQC